jgi:hypothetical protein
MSRDLVLPIRMGDGVRGSEPSAEHPRTSKPGTCLWCGRKLRLAKAAQFRGTTNRGDYGDNAFCTLRCGYQFGVAMAKNDRRLIDYPTKWVGHQNKR